MSYTLPRHILVMPDGDRRFARRHQLSHADTYGIAARNVVAFAGTAFGQFPIQIISFFLTRPATYEPDTQRRGIRNLVAVHDAIGNIAPFFEESGFIEPLDLGFAIVGNLNMPQRMASTTELECSWNTMLNKLQGLCRRHPSAEATLRFNFLINYSGSQALRDIIRSAEPEVALRDELGGDVGLMVRTGDGIRISDGPAHQMYDSHAVHIPRLWPEVGSSDVCAAVGCYFEAGRQERVA